MRRVQLFAVQARVDRDSYASEDAFASLVRSHAEAIDQRRERGEDGRPRTPALAVWPEMVASFLPIAGRSRVVAGCTTSDQAMQRVALRLLPRVALAALRTRPRSLNEAFMATVGPEVWRIWWRTFSRIARDFDLWVVAGSALVPVNANGIDTDEMSVRSARFFNTSLTFAPDGRAVAVTRKLNVVPTQEDVLGMSAGTPADLAAVATPFGKLGTLICYDGFREAHTSTEPCFLPGAPLLDGLGVEIIAQPSANAWEWDAPWVFNDDGEHQLRSEQWFAEGLFSAMGDLTSVRYAVNPQLVGEIFELRFEAPSLIMERRDDGEVVVLARSEDPTGADVLDVVVDC